MRVARRIEATAIRERLSDELKRYQDEELKEKIISRLIEQHSFTAPPSMVERQTRYLMERYQNQMAYTTGRRWAGAAARRKLEKLLKVARFGKFRRLSWWKESRRSRKIEVTDKEVQERVDGVARAAAERAKTVREFYSRADARDDLRAQMVFDRTVSFLLERRKDKGSRLAAF